MRFSQPYMFNVFWIVVGFILFLLWNERRYAKRLHAFVEQHLVKHITPAHIQFIRIIHLWLLGLAALFAILALARPQWGYEWQDSKRQGLDIMLVIDTSKSMMAVDVKPNRLERTKLAIMDLIRKLKGDRIGIIAFAGEAFELCPLTSDYNGFLLSFNNLNTDVVPRGGTNIGNAIQKAIEGYENVPSKYRAIILVTDGENLEGDPLKWAKKAKEKNIKIFTVGIGTKEGELIPEKTITGTIDYKKDEKGNFVKSRLNEKLLEDISHTSEGVYVKASGADFGLDYIYQNHLSNWEKREFEDKAYKKYHERFMWPLILAFLLLIFDTIVQIKGKTFFKWFKKTIYEE